MNKKVGICLIQMHVTYDKEHNILTAIRLIKTAVEKYNPKLVVLPENFNTWWGKNDYVRNAEIIPTGETITALINLAKTLKIYIVGGSIAERDIKNKDVFYNTTVVLSPTGQLIAKYRKIHLTDVKVRLDRKFDDNKRFETDYRRFDDRYTTDVKRFDDRFDDEMLFVRESDYLDTGNTLTTFEIDNVKIGLGIGFDLLHSELATLYRKAGCDVLIYPAAFPADLGVIQWEQLNRTRAIDNQVFVVGVSPARDDTNRFVAYGHSMLVDPRGRVLVRGFDKEEILYTDLDFTDVDKYRNQIKLLNHKRVDMYDTVQC